PHDRQPPVHEPGPVGQLLAAGDPVHGRVLAQLPSRRPDLRAPRCPSWTDRHLRADHLDVRAVRLGVAGALADHAPAGANGRAEVSSVTSNVSHSDGEFARSRAHAEAEAAIMRDRAVRTVTEQAVDTEDLHSLLAMLGLEQ